MRGDAAIIDQDLHLTSIGHCEKGSIWSSEPIKSNNWQFEMTYTASSKDKIMADGLAIWYVPISASKGIKHTTYGGPHSPFLGLMIAIDTFYDSSFKDTAKERELSESSIIVVNNENFDDYNLSKEKNYQTLGRCIVNNRQTKETEINSIFVTYFNNILKIEHSGLGGDRKSCFTKKGFSLPKGHVFGISAANGGYKGHFIVHSFNFYQSDEYVESFKTVEDNVEKSITTPKPEVVAKDYVLYIMSALCVMMFLGCIILLAYLYHSRKPNIQSPSTVIDEYVDPIELSRVNNSISYNQNYKKDVVDPSCSYNKLNFEPKKYYEQVFLGAKATK